MTSPKLKILERQMLRREERIPAAPETGIGAAIEELIAGEVARKVGEVEKAANNKKLDRLFKPEPRYTSFEQLDRDRLPPAPKRKRDLPTMTVTRRDPFGRAMEWECGDVRFTVTMRDELGRLVSVTPSRISGDVPPLPAMEYTPPPRVESMGE